MSPWVPGPGHLLYQATHGAHRVEQCKFDGSCSFVSLGQLFVSLYYICLRLDISNIAVGSVTSLCRCVSAQVFGGLSSGFLGFHFNQQFPKHLVFPSPRGNLHELSIQVSCLCHAVMPHKLTKLMELQLKYLDLFMIDIRCIIHQMGVLYTN